MKALVCDRCGKTEFDSTVLESVVTDKEGQEFDLCLECEVLLQDFLKPLKPDQE